MGTRIASEGGALLVELLVTVVILGLAFAGILAGIAGSAGAAATSQQHTLAEATSRSLAEELKAAAWSTTCPPTYAVAAPAGTTVLLEVAWGDATGSFTATCQPGAPLQRLTLTVTPAGEAAARRIEVVKRSPT